MHETLQKFWDEVVDVWQHGFMGVDISKIIVAIGIFSIFLILRGLFSKYVLNKLHAFAARSDTTMDDKVVDALIPPIRFVPILMGLFFATSSLDLEGNLADFIYRVERSLIAFTIFWALHRALEPVSGALGGLRKILTDTMTNWIFKVLKIVVIFIGAAVILEMWGIEIAPLLAGLGLFGAAVALGAQDLFKNLIGGMTVIAEKRFHPGEWIMVEGVVEGIVEDIGFRSTKVRRFDKAPVHVPNSQLADTVVTNFSRMTHRRIYWKIGVVYSTSIDQLKTIRDGITKYLNDNSDVFASPEDVNTFVRVDSFNNSSIDILVYCFTKTTVWGEWLKAKEDFALAIKEIVEGAGSSFAFPSQSLYVESIPGDAAEIFVPPKK